MATEAQLRAIKKWSTEKVEEIKIRVPKGQKAEIKRLQKHTAKRSTHLSTDLSITQ